MQSWDVSIHPSAKWRGEDCWISWAGLNKNRPEAVVAAFTRISVNGWKMTWFEIRAMAFNNVEATFNGLRSNNGRSMLLSCLVSMGTGPECQGKTRHYPVNIPPINQPVNGVSRRTSTGRVFYMPNQTLTQESSIRTKKKIGPKFCIDSFIAIHNIGTDWYSILVDQSLQRTVSLKMLRPALVSRWHTCGFNWMELITICTCHLYIGFTKSDSVASVFWKRHLTEKLLVGWSNTPPRGCFPL